MRADTIEAHEALTRSARDLAHAWQGTDPMRSIDEVRRALVATIEYPEDEARVNELLPYLVDACRSAGLLVEVSS